MYHSIVKFKNVQNLLCLRFPRAQRTIFKIFKNDKHHKTADKILHLTFPPLPHRTLLKVLSGLLKYQLSVEQTIVPEPQKNLVF